ncbi:MAG: hypothetical protein F7C35_00325 [Desulfurococcales archaeon]|nr:hypothetical protein [Desulfurococcales archaeon]
MEKAIRFGAALTGESLELKGPGCLWLDSGRISSITSTGSCPQNALGGDRLLILPQPGLAHAHSADYAFTEYGAKKPISALVSYPGGEKHKRLIRLSRSKLVEATRRYYLEALRLGVGVILDFREMGGYGCETARQALAGVEGLDVVLLGRPGPGWPGACDGLGISSPLDYPLEDLKSLVKIYRPSAAHVAETPATLEAGDFDLAVELGFDFIIHGTFLRREHLGELAKRGIGLVFSVRSNMWHGLGLPPVLEALGEEGLLVALGSDNAAWIPPDPWGELSGALYAARLQGFVAEEEARKLLSAAFIAPYVLAGLKPRLVAEGSDAHLVGLYVDVDSLLDSESPMLWIAKRVGAGLIVIRVDGERVSKPFIG